MGDVFREHMLGIRIITTPKQLSAEAAMRVCMHIHTYTLVSLFLCACIPKAHIYSGMSNSNKHHRGHSSFLPLHIRNSLC